MKVCSPTKRRLFSIRCEFHASAFDDEERRRKEENSLDVLLIHVDCFEDKMLHREIDVVDGDESCNVDENGNTLGLGENELLARLGEDVDEIFVEEEIKFDHGFVVLEEETQEKKVDTFKGIWPVSFVRFDDL